MIAGARGGIVARVRHFGVTELEKVVAVATVKPITLTTTGIRTAVRQLEGFDLTQRMLAVWQKYGLVAPSIDKGSGSGRGGRSAIWSLNDLARVRLICYLRARGISLPRVRAAFAYMEAELAEMFQPHSKAVLVVDAARMRVEHPDRPTVDIPSGQLRLRLDSMFQGNKKAAKEAAAA